MRVWEQDCSAYKIKLGQLNRCCWNDDADTCHWYARTYFGLNGSKNRGEAGCFGIPLASLRAGSSTAFRMTIFAVG
jgi:hypothetical protein